MMHPNLTSKQQLPIMHICKFGGRVTSRCGVTMLLEDLMGQTALHDKDGGIAR